MNAPPSPDGEDPGPAAVELGPPTASIATPRQGDIYNPEPGRENIRGAIALCSVALFAATIAVILLSVAFGGRTWEEMEGVTAAALPAVTTLMGSTVGFYFGTQERQRRP